MSICCAWERLLNRAGHLLVAGAVPDVDAALHLRPDVAHVKVPWLLEQVYVLKEHGRGALAQALRHYQVRVLPVLLLDALPASCTPTSHHSLPRTACMVINKMWLLRAPALGAPHRTNLAQTSRDTPCVISIHQMFPCSTWETCGSILRQHE